VADPAIPPIDKACGEGMMPDSLRAAAALGIHLDTRAAFPFAGIRFLDGETRVGAIFPDGVGLGMRRTALHQCLVETAAAAGVNLAWGAAVLGIHGEIVRTSAGHICTRWIIGADGGNSRVRQWAGLSASAIEKRRFGFRAHYRVAPWSELMEVHWSEKRQLYITPVGPDEVAVALLSDDPRLRLAEGLTFFPDVARRLANRQCSAERGGVSGTRRLKAVCRGRIALTGDSSGSVDAITGEGIGLAFRQAAALADALARNDLSQYQTAHRRLRRRPELMAHLMLLLGRHGGLRRRVVGTMAAHPRLFARMLAAHIGEVSTLKAAADGLGLVWRVLTT
jgi:flavin-dependent dehydrogenase